MIDALANLIARFPRQKNRVRCFAHIINLVVKVILCQFNLHIKKTAAGKGELTKQLKEALEVDEMSPEDDNVAPGEEESEDNKMIGLDKVEEAVKERIGVMEAQSKPVRLILTKVRFYHVSALNGR